MRRGNFSPSYNQYGLDGIESTGAEDCLENECEEEGIRKSPQSWTVGSTWKGKHSGVGCREDEAWRFLWDLLEYIMRKVSSLEDGGWCVGCVMQ